MKCAFSFNGNHYVAPSKKEARRFLKMFGEKDILRRFKTSWKLKTVERAPSYCQQMRINLDHVEFRNI